MAWSIVGTPVAEIDGGGGTSTPFTITIPSGTQRVIFFVEYREGGGSGIVQPDGVTIGAEVAAFVNSAGGAERPSNRVECWYLDNPTPGTDLSGSVAFTELVNDVIIWAACQDGLDLIEAPVSKNSGEDSDPSTLSASIASASWAASVHFLAGCGDGDVYPFGAATGWTTAFNNRTGTSQFGDVSGLVAHKIGADPAGAENFSCSVNGGPTTWLWIEQKVAAGGSTDATATPSGVSATAAVGTVAVTVDATTTPSGLEATAAVGTVSISTGANDNAAPDGVEATASVGTVTVRLDSTATVEGVSGTGGVGSVTASVVTDATVTLTGVSGTGAVGTVTVAGLATVAAVSGVSAVGSVGTVVIKGWLTPPPAATNWTGEAAANDIWTAVPKASGNWS